MTPEIKALFDVFGTQAAIARAFGVTAPSVIKWVRAGRLPPLRRYQWRDMRRTAGEPITAPPAARRAKG